jgi:NADH-quinone oxidoreductase subunit J
MPPIALPESVQPLLTAEFILFAVFAVGAVATAVVMVLQTNPVRSALFLVLNLFSVAVLYLLLHAWFLAAVQVIVYAGAIMVLFLFVIMLLNLGTPDRTVDPLRPQQPIAVLAGLILAGVIGWTVLSTVQVPAGVRPDSLLGTVESVGTNLFDPNQPWLFPFEVTSILLLIAVIGAVVLAKRRVEGE